MDNHAPLGDRRKTEHEVADSHFLLVDFARKTRERTRGIVQRNFGFTDKEALCLKEIFDRYDHDGSGDIANKELRTLLMGLFPHLAGDPLNRPRIRAVIDAADEDRNGSLDFGDFLRLVRECHDIDLWSHFEREQQAIKDSGFTVREVAEFRELFMGEEERSVLKLEDMKEMLSKIIPLGHKNSEELGKLFEDMVKGSHDGKALFPDFLLLMRHLLNINFAAIAEVG